MNDPRKLAEEATSAHDHDHCEPEECEDCPGPRPLDCGCDACFYGKDKLVQAILALLDERDALEKENEALEQFYADAYPRTPGQSLKSNHLTVLRERDALLAEVAKVRLAYAVAANRACCPGCGRVREHLYAEGHARGCALEDA